MKGKLINGSDVEMDAAKTVKAIPSTGPFGRKARLSLPGLKLGEQGQIRGPWRSASEAKAKRAKRSGRTRGEKNAAFGQVAHS